MLSRLVRPLCNSEIWFTDDEQDQQDVIFTKDDTEKQTQQNEKQTQQNNCMSKCTHVRLFNIRVFRLLPDIASIRFYT